MSISSFEELAVWNKSKQLAIDIHMEFKSSKEYAFKNQIFRAAISVANNIAEGFERYSTKELIRFLFIAKSSCGEVRSMLYVAEEIFPGKSSQFMELQETCKLISSMLMNLIKKLRSKQC